ncbi:hypothetical protein I79_013107 [Cricetulus griseus]|uniref:Uncharacterized protein n=1 Tax=Cricetulus griseus TaxID=10029 RepID=G3HQK3_CRIGR|nr:hypothetical protein I79_013107 [Cricetulus griseus]
MSDTPNRATKLYEFQTHLGSLFAGSLSACEFASTQDVIATSNWPHLLGTFILLFLT